MGSILNCLLKKLSLSPELFNIHHFSISHSIVFCASSAEFPQISMSALNPLHTAGRFGSLKMPHFKSCVKCIHLTPPGLPSGIPGIGELIEGKIQHAPHPERHSIAGVYLFKRDWYR